MKKQLSLASKRKWVTGGILAFSAVSLLTTCFATWVVGVQRVKQANGVSIIVDTAKESSVRLTAKVTQNTVLSESETVTTGFVTATNADEFSADALKVKFDELSVMLGKDATQYTKVTFKFGTLDASDVYTAVTYEASNNELNGKKINNVALDLTSRTDLHFIEAPVELALNETKFS